MMAVDAHGATAQRGEVDYSGARFDADAIEGFEPCANLLGAVASEEAETQ